MLESSTLAVTSLETAGTVHPPTVSVVMSVYNGARYLRESVESILSQEGVDIEFVIVDDGSTDESPTILDAYAVRDSRVRILRQQNTGLTRALIRGCAAARGEFIARQDADDVSQPDRLVRQTEILRSRPAVGFVSCTTQYVGPHGEPLSTMTRTADAAAATHALLFDRQGPPAHGSVMFRRSVYLAVGGYRPEFYYGQDSDLWLRMAEHSLIAYCAELLYIARRDPQGISGAQGDWQARFGELGQRCRLARVAGQSEELCLSEARNLCFQLLANRNSGASSDVSAAIAMNYLLGSELCRKGDPRARVYLLAAIRRQPWHWKAWVRLLQTWLPLRAAAGPTDANA